MNVNMKTGIFEALNILPNCISDVIRSSNRLYEIDEIRLRNNKPISISARGKNFFLQKNGELCNFSSDRIYATRSDVEMVFKSAFSYSIHSYFKELANGYITIRGGNRVGICGTAVLANDYKNTVDTLKYISSINIRISREVIGCADRIINYCKLPSGILIIGPPSSGKTTIIRDIARIIGNRHSVSLIDELNEISATYKDEATCNVGLLTDVFVGYPKDIGIRTAVKVMSPKYIIVDEIGSKEDVNALSYALNSGVNIITAIHSDSLESAMKKPNVNKLISSKTFNYAVVLQPYDLGNYEYKVIKID